MCSLSKILAANNAAEQARRDWQAQLNADFALLRATDTLLAQIRSMHNDAMPRQSVFANVLAHAEQLKPLMKRYGVELIPSATLVNKFDLRILGTETACGEQLPKFGAFVDMDGPLGSSINCAQEAKPAGHPPGKESEWVFPQASCCTNKV